MKKQYIKVTTSGTFFFSDKKCTILHRTDGPAIVRADGTKVWYQHGNLHRTDGPAIEHANGDKRWYINGKRHREDGPAIEWADGDRAWYLEGEAMSEEEHARCTAAQEMTVAQIEAALGYKVKVVK